MNEVLSTARIEEIAGRSFSRRQLREIKYHLRVEKDKRAIALAIASRTIVNERTVCRKVAPYTGNTKLLSGSSMMQWDYS